MKIMKYINIKKSFYINNIFLCVILITFLFPKNTYALDDFFVDSYVKYDYLDNGEANVTHKIILENKISTIFAKSYSISFQNINPKNINIIDDKDNLYMFTVSENNGVTNIKIDFPDSLIGMGEKRTFYLKYLSGEFSKKYGEIIEINIPKLSDPDNFRNYQVEIIVPPSFGKISYISPGATSENQINSKNIYYYGKNIISNSGVVAAFGDFQVFDFSLNYHLENPLTKLGETEIALPPDTSYQRIYFQEISPMPLEILSDEDGNWLAKYVLNPRQIIDITVKGSVKVFSRGIKNTNISSEYLSKNLSPTEFWQTKSPEIKKLSNELKTANNIYEYIVRNLSYDYEKVKPNSVRLGAIETLINPDNAICMEFTDLFVALARASGIPAREINGYAYADNPNIQPQSLVADVLHSWPEYYDYDKQLWIPIDPTWGNTTGGEDYFNKLDLRHFTFVIHGTDSIKPYPPGSYKLGVNPQKDVFVTFGKLPESQGLEINIDTIGNNKVYYPGKKIEILIENKNGYSMENEYLTIYFDGMEKYKYKIPLILPFSSYKTEIDYPFSLFGKNTPKEIKLTFNGKEHFIYDIKIASIINSLIIIFIILSINLFVYVIYIKRNNIIFNIKKVFKSNL